MTRRNGGVNGNGANYSALEGHVAGHINAAGQINATGGYGRTGSQSTASGTRNRGFASMDPARQREIASQGGKAAHAKGTAHEFTSEEARQAGSQSHRNVFQKQY